MDMFNITTTPLHDQEVNRLNEMLVEEKKNLQQKMSAGENVQEDRSKLAQLQW